MWFSRQVRGLEQGTNLRAGRCEVVWWRALGVGLGGGVQQYSGYWRPWRPSIG